MVDASNEEDDKTRVQLGSVELEPRQFRQQGSDHLWDLIGYVNFGTDDVEIPNVGFLRLSVNRAVLRLDFQDCDIAQRDAGYKTLVEDSRVLQQSERTRTKGKSKGRLGGKFGLGFSKGVNADAYGEGDLSKEKNVELNIQQDYKEIRHLVTFSKKDVETGSLEWEIASVDPEKGLFGAVIDGEDTKAGRLGTLKASKKGGWSIKPSIRFEPYAEIVNQQELTTVGKAKQKSMLGKNEARLGRKLGVISALLGKEMAHVDLPSFEMSDDEGEQ